MWALATVDTQDMSAFVSSVEEPFRSDPDFAASVAASADGLLGLLLAAALAGLFGAVGAVAFVLPAALLVRAGVSGRRSARRSRGAFADRRAWRDAERQAVAAVFGRAVVRRREILGG